MNERLYEKEWRERGRAQDETCVLLGGRDGWDGQRATRAPPRQFPEPKPSAATLSNSAPYPLALVRKYRRPLTAKALILTLPWQISLPENSFVGPLVKVQHASKIHAHAAIVFYRILSNPAGIWEYSLSVRCRAQTKGSSPSTHEYSPHA